MDEAERKKLEDKRMEAARRLAREAAQMLVPVFACEQDLDTVLYSEPPNLSDHEKNCTYIMHDFNHERRDSIMHIMTVFAAESVVTKRELAFHLLVPHALKALPGVPNV